MSFAALRSLVWDVNLAMYGVPAVVTRPAPSNTPVSVTAIWRVTPQQVPTGAGFQAIAPQRVLAIPRGSLPTLPIGTAVTAPEYQGGPSRSWVVDSLESVEYDHFRAVMVPA